MGERGASVLTRPHCVRTGLNRRSIVLVRICGDRDVLRIVAVLWNMHSCRCRPVTWFTTTLASPNSHIDIPSHLNTNAGIVLTKKDPFLAQHSLPTHPVSHFSYIHTNRSQMAYPDQPASPGMTSPRRMTNRNTNRYSVTALFSMAAEQDVEVEDDLARGPCFSDSLHTWMFLTVRKQLRSVCEIWRAKYLLSLKRISFWSEMFDTLILVSLCSFRIGWHWMK